MNEVKDFHPLVAAWLTANGYEFVHEYKMPEYGRVDFFAIHPTTRKITLVECKPEKDLNAGIFQLLGYHAQMPEAALWLAVDKASVTPSLKNLASKYNVEILEIDTLGAGQESSESDEIFDIESFNMEMRFAEALFNPHGSNIQMAVLIAQYKTVFERFVVLLMEVSPYESYQQVKQEIEALQLKKSHKAAMVCLDKAIEGWAKMDIDAIIDGSSGEVA